MKQLKYLKLFEAFESIKLSKTLGYLNSEDKQNFLDLLKRMCKRVDFPLSNLSDDMFSYLPFNRAYNLDVELEDKPCTGSSIQQFQDSGIEGEVCQSGRIKRLWGERVRQVECKRCSGTGIEPKEKNIYLLKFWFTKDGKFVDMTACDGTKIEVKKVSGEIQPTQIHKLREIPNLTKVYITTRRSDSPVPATLFIEGRDIYCIQDRYDGGSPSYSSTWRNFGRYSWNVSGGDFYKISIPSDEGEKSEQQHNYMASVTHRGDISISKNSDTKTNIKDAHFALVFDYDKFINSEFQKKSHIQSQRTELKKGSRLTLSDEDIRNQNIERYLLQLAEKGNIVTDIKNVKSVTSRIIGGNLVIFLISGRRYFERNFERIIDNYLQILKLQNEGSISQDSIDDSINYLRNLIKNSYEESAQYKINVSKTLKYCKDTLQKGGDEIENREDYLQIIADLEEISQIAYQRFMSLPFDCIEDLEIVKSKIKSIKEIFSNDTWGVSSLSQFLNYVINGSERQSYDSLANYWRVASHLNDIKSGLQNVKRIISRI